jgi:hypothetical protein
VAAEDRVELAMPQGGKPDALRPNRGNICKAFSIRCRAAQARELTAASPDRSGAQRDRNASTAECGERVLAAIATPLASPGTATIDFVCAGCVRAHRREVVRVRGRWGFP